MRLVEVPVLCLSIPKHIREMLISIPLDCGLHFICSRKLLEYRFGEKRKQSLAHPGSHKPADAFLGFAIRGFIQRNNLWLVVIQESTTAVNHPVAHIVELRQNLFSM